jgi:hypothetical protein
LLYYTKNNNRVKKVVYRVVYLKIDAYLPPIAPYICPGISCKHVAFTSVDIIHHILQHSSPVLPSKFLAALHDNIMKQVEGFVINTELLEQVAGTAELALEKDYLCSI